MIELMKEKVGTFKGFTESQLEFSAELVMPYNAENPPRLGSFLLVSITPEKSVLGRITKFTPTGGMSNFEGEEYLAKMHQMRRQIPEDLKESKLRYNVNVKLLGCISLSGETKKPLMYTPSVRRLPHLGSDVGIPSDDVVSYICQLGIEVSSETATEIGHLALGDIVYDGEEGTQDFPVQFDIGKLIARRTFVFARAGYGKSNLVKLLTAKLYEREQLGGLLIIDPEGEYSFLDRKGRHGLADVSHLRSKLVVYTNHSAPTPELSRYIAGAVKFDLSDLRPSDIVDICITERKRSDNFANALRGLFSEQWDDLITLIANNRYRTENAEITDIVGISSSASLDAIKNNLTPIIDILDDAKSTMLQSIKYHLKEGRIVVVDVSHLGTVWGRRVAGLILRELFNHNQLNFTEGSVDDMIPLVAIIEEAQTVLSSADDDTSPFVSWAKEGRKYELGGIFVTQQPGSIASSLLSQGDNFFAFHLLSADDLRSLKSSNAHFSDDILADILNEPIKGSAYFWSAPDQPFVLACQILDFEKYVEEQKSVKVLLQSGAPAEEFHRINEEKGEKFRALIKAEIETNQWIDVTSKVKIEGEQKNDLFAVNLLKLKYALAQKISDELRGDFVEQTEGGKAFAKHVPLVRALRRMGASNQGIERWYESGKSYIIVRRSVFKLSRPETSGLSVEIKMEEREQKPKTSRDGKEDDTDVNQPELGKYFNASGSSQPA